MRLTGTRRRVWIALGMATVAFACGPPVSIAWWRLTNARWGAWAVAVTTVLCLAMHVEAVRQIAIASRAAAHADPNRPQ